MIARLASLALVACWLVSAPAARAQEPAPYEQVPEDEPAADAAPAPAAAPPVSTHFRYHLRQTVAHGTGAYAGWTDTLVSVGDYGTTDGTVHASYRWAYDSAERTDHGLVTRNVAFDPVTRRYTSDQTDLDDYDETPTATLATWLWIPPSAAVGEHVRILDDDFRVMGPEDVEIAGSMRHTIHVQGEPSGTRDDDYGRFSTTSIDDYWFDAATGMFLREIRIETDRGRLEGSAAGFEMRLEATVVDATYAPAVGPLPPDPVTAMSDDAQRDDARRRTAEADDSQHWAFFMLLAVPFALVVFAVFANRRMGNPFHTKPYVVQRLGSDTLPAPELGRLSPHLGTFLVHIADVAQRAGNGVYVARGTSSGRVEGVAIDDADARILAIYAPDPDCAEALRTNASRLELIAEHRYAVLPTVQRALRDAGRAEPRFAYNLYESFDVMTRRGPIAPVDYDASVVVRMKPEDVAEATVLAQRVYGVPCQAYLRACLELEDVAFVAKREGKILGMALATVVGNAARLHTLLVDPDERSRGLGKELYRARLRALSDLGVDLVVTEVAVNNPAAMAVAVSFGMTKEGEMHVQSARPTREPITVVRR